MKELADRCKRASFTCGVSTQMLTDFAPRLFYRCDLRRAAPILNNTAHDGDGYLTFNTPLGGDGYLTLNTPLGGDGYLTLNTPLGADGYLTLNTPLGGDGYLTFNTPLGGDGYLTFNATLDHGYLTLTSHLMMTGT